jgi:hypothetical protein
MLVGDTPSGEATLILPDGVIVRPPPLQWQLPDGVTLEADRFGWSADLASKGASFFGHPVALKIDTSASPVSGPPPPPSRAELSLASVIIQSLSSVLSLCEEKFSEDTRRYDGTATQHVRAPHIEPTFWLPLLLPSYSLGVLRSDELLAYHYSYRHL